ncbi:MAG: sensor domain-containing diguanylate cyclase [Pyrinomonadaceae bacterium]
MTLSAKSDFSSKEANRLKRLYFFQGLAGIACLILMFLIASSDVGRGPKLFAAAGVAVIFTAVYFISYKMQRGARFIENFPAYEQTDPIEEKLLALDEAHQFFGTSLSSADMFRLISSRVSDIFPSAATVLFLADEANAKLRIAQADGRNLNLLVNNWIAMGDGLAGKAALSRLPETTAEIKSEEQLMPEADLAGFQSAAAIPLLHENEVFGVLILYSTSPAEAEAATVQLLETIGERIAPIFRGSMVFERSLSTALIDPLTGLPNERAFFMILENQLAESHRYRDERPLTVLVLDIKGFSEVNSGFDHATGDRLLGFAADLVKDQLRKMDFLARSVNDEFVVILPTANEKTTLEIVERIKTSFVNSPFEIPEKESIKIGLNYGWATFWQDGETPQQLLQNARLRKRQAKSEDPGKVLWFPKEYVN